ncbi:MAG TPA: hypothetical protein DD782_02635 [Firmicutes bacterium]|nr:hypothetical protein [Bacillota bacterium]
MDREQIVVVQETEYTGAGKHPTAQLSFARQQGIEIRRGDPRENVPGKAIVLPTNPGQISVVDYDLNSARRSYLRKATEGYTVEDLDQVDLEFLADETRWSKEKVIEEIRHGLQR